LNLWTRTLKQGKSSTYSKAKINGAANSHPNNCKNQENKMEGIRTLPQEKRAENLAKTIIGRNYQI